MKRKGAFLLLTAILLPLVLCSCGGPAHNYGSWIDDTAATCTTAGMKGHYHCIDCDKYFDAEKLEVSAEELEIPAIGHVEGPWTVDVEPTCTTEGSHHLTCAICGITMRTESIPKADHTPGEWIVDTEPTCSTAGSRHRDCTVCGNTVETESIDTLEHTPGRWKTVTPSTTTTPGERVRICSVCGQQIPETSEEIPVIPTNHVHTYSDWIVDSEPTCTEAGHTHKECTVCGATLEENDIPATGHEFGEWIEEIPETQTEEGVKGHYHCPKCDKNFDSNHNELDTIIILPKEDQGWSIVV